MHSAAPIAHEDTSLSRLIAELASYESVVVAFSGGIDSALVLRGAIDALGADRVLAITARSPAVPDAEIADASRLAAEFGAVHEFIDTDELANPDYAANPANRCYHCKTELYSRLSEIARQRGYRTVANGVNADDLGDYRPGLIAAGEHRVRAPLADCGLSKADVRRVARRLGVSAHDKPASPCLSSRVQYGEAITPEKLRRIEQCELVLRGLGFRECRVRHHDVLARIEVPSGEMSRFADPALREEITRRLRELGYRYVTLDLLGFRSGSMNEVLLGPGLRSAR